MPITPFLDGTKFDLEAKRVMGVAFEMARVALGLALNGGLVKDPYEISINSAFARDVLSDPLCTLRVGVAAASRYTRFQAAC